MADYRTTAADAAAPVERLTAEYDMGAERRHHIEAVLHVFGGNLLDPILESSEMSTGGGDAAHMAVARWAEKAASALETILHVAQEVPSATPVRILSEFPKLNSRHTASG